MKINFHLIKKLREKTGFGFLDCKEALIKSNLDVNLAIDYIRKLGKKKIKKGRSFSSNKGIVRTDISFDKKLGVIFKLCCESDFVSKNKVFLDFADKISNIALLKKVVDISVLNKKIENIKIEVFNKVKENIVLKKYRLLITNNYMVSYVHLNRIAVLLDIDLPSNSEEHFRLAQKIAMHIAACNPLYIDSKSIPNSFLEKEYQIQFEIAKRTKKSENIIKKIALGRLNKFKEEITLSKQNFIINPSRKMKEIFEENKIKINKFIRYEI